MNFFTLDNLGDTRSAETERQRAVGDGLRVLPGSKIGFKVGPHQMLVEVYTDERTETRLLLTRTSDLRSYALSLTMGYVNRALRGDLLVDEAGGALLGRQIRTLCAALEWQGPNRLAFRPLAARSRPAALETKGSSSCDEDGEDELGSSESKYNDPTSPPCYCPQSPRKLAINATRRRNRGRSGSGGHGVVWEDDR